MTFPAEVWRSLLTPQSFLDRSAAVFPERTAVVYGTIRRPYRELATRVNRLANALRTAGLQKGDRVAFLCPNTPPLLEAHFAVPLAGGALVAINTRLSADEIHYILRHSGARLLFVDAELAHLVAGRREELDQLELVCIINDDQIEPVAPVLEGPDYEAFLADSSPAPLTSLLVTEEDIISINYTSGTTGQPKGVMYTHRGAYLNALGECLEVGFTSDSVYLWTLSMFHCNGWCFPWGVVAMGGSQVCLRRLEPEAVIRLVRDERVSHFCAAPTVLIMMLNHPAIGDLQLRRPLTVVTAAAPPSPTVIQAVEELGARIIHVYGLTE
ncbi:MAG: Acetyl-coenzyme A synthetase, partial [uncultured Chloroflexia bacterium]